MQKHQFYLKHFVQDSMQRQLNLFQYSSITRDIIPVVIFLYL